MATAAADGSAAAAPAQSTHPLSAARALAGVTAYKEPQLAAGWLYWLEQRPAEQGRTTLLRRLAPVSYTHLTLPTKA